MSKKMKNIAQSEVLALREQISYQEGQIVSNQQAMELAGSNTVLVVVDVNKPSITECPELLRMCKSIVVLDHHRQTNEQI